MKIDKSKLMKTAWKLARNGFYNAAFRSISIPGDRDFTTEQIDGLCKLSLSSKQEAFFYGARLRGTMTVNFTVKDFFADSLKQAWAQVKKVQEKKAAANTVQTPVNTAKINKNAPKRELVPADKYTEGDRLGRYIITGLGATFRPHVDMFSLGITPDTDWVQYAYFKI